MTTEFEPIRIGGIDALTSIDASYYIDRDRREVVIRCDELESAALTAFAASLPDSDVTTRVRDGVASPPPYQLLVHLSGNLHRGRITHLNGERSLWLGDSYKLREERIRDSALAALTKLSELGVRALVDINEMEGNFSIFADVADVWPLRAAVDAAMLFDCAAMVFEIGWAKQLWTDYLYLGEAGLASFKNADEFAAWRAGKWPL